MNTLPQFALTFLGVLFCIGDVAALGLLLLAFTQLMLLWSRE